MLHLKDALPGLVQGVCEFLPISSSAHLLLISPELTASHIVALHAGTLFVIFAYYWRDCLNLVRGGLDLLRLRWTDDSRQSVLLLISFLPIAITGGFIDLFIKLPNGPRIMGFSSILFGLLLAISGQLKSTKTRVSSTYAAFLVGLAQVISVIPGVSRMGATLCCLKFMGYKTGESIRFSMLMSVPVIISASLWHVIKSLLGMSHEAPLEFGTTIIVSTIVSIIFGLITLKLINKYAEKSYTLPIIGAYRIAIGMYLVFW